MQSKETMKLLRKVIGIVGFALPIALVVFLQLSGWQAPLKSMSAYHWTGAREVLTGSLILMGVVLLTYEGYDRTDNRIATLAGLGMIGVAALPAPAPCSIADPMYLIPIQNLQAGDFSVLNALHGLAAVVAFGFVGAMSFFRFTLSPTRSWKDGVYRGMGITIWVSLAVVTVFYFTLPANWEWLIFVVEAIMVWAFATAWWVKNVELKN